MYASLPARSYLPPGPVFRMRSYGIHRDVMNGLLILAGAVALFLLLARLMRW